jgi:hypothetical protein
MSAPKLPGAPTRYCDTSTSADMIALLGGSSFESVSFTRDQVRALSRVYGFDADLNARLDEAERQHAEQEQATKERHAQVGAKYPLVLRPFDRAAMRRFMQSGDERNLFRHAKRDGLRIMAFLSRFCDPDEDPVKVVVRVMHAAGYDVDPADMAWADADFDSSYDVEEADEYAGEE